MPFPLHCRGRGAGSYSCPSVWRPSWLVTTAFGMNRVILVTAFGRDLKYLPVSLGAGGPHRLVTARKWSCHTPGASGLTILVPLTNRDLLHAVNVRPWRVVFCPSSHTPVSTQSPGTRKPPRKWCPGSPARLVNLRGGSWPCSSEGKGQAALAPRIVAGLAAVL